MARQLEPHEIGSSEVWEGLLGTKVSLRYRIHDDHEHPFSEAVGMVQSVVAGADGVARLTIVNRRGRQSEMAVDDVLAAKTF